MNVHDSFMMEDKGHRAAIEAALNFEPGSRVPVNNFANIAAVRSAGHVIKDARFDSRLSSSCTIRYAKMTGSDFIKPCLDTNVEFMDITVPGKVEMVVPDDNYTRISGHVISEPEDADKLEFYDPFVPKECPQFTKGFVENIEALAESMDEDWHICGFCWAPFSFAGFLMGAENMMMDIMMDGDLLRAVLNKTERMSADLQRRCIDAGATVMWMADPTAGEDLISSDTYKEYEFDHLKHVVDSVKAFRPDAPILYHMCGYTANTMRLLPNAGVQCFSCDTKTDLAEARASAGRKLAIMGNVDPVGTLLMGTPEKVIAEVTADIAKAYEDGGYIVAPGCEVPRDAPDENVIAMYTAASRFLQS